VIVASIKSYIQPATLYRYRPLKNFDRDIESIKDASLHCAPFNTLNDPMEGFYTSSKRLRESERYSFLKRLIASNKALLGICSFSEVHNNELMWAHYADQYRGICIAYNFASLQSNLDHNVEFIRLSYSEKAPTLHSKEDADFLAKRALSCKNYRWLYEREWRLLAPMENISYRKVRCVTCVYLGSRIQPEHSRRIIAEMKSLGIPTKRMLIDRYSMAFEPCEQSKKANV
jgi:hypothetical protein